MDDLLQLWGKTVRDDPEAYHPALYHMLDAGHVAQALLSDRAPRRWRSVLSRALQCDEQDVCALVPWLVSLHDLGKCSQAFQQIVPAQEQRLVRSGAPFSRHTMVDLPHSLVGASAWPSLGTGPVGALPDQLREALRQVVGGHHGFWLRPGQAQHARRRIQAMEPAFWRQARRLAVLWLWDHLAPSLPRRDTADLSPAIMSLTGFTILCDWLASDESYFHPSAEVPLEAYVTLSRERADQAVRETGLAARAHSVAPPLFAGLFTGIGSPRPLQTAIDAVPDFVLSEPTLAFIEAPTGEGKTEAALALAHRIGARIGSDALYYALPTMATSNQMFIRVNAYLGQALGLEARSKLVHGQAYLIEDDLAPQPLSNGDDEAHPMLSWFGPLKKALLASFGVGTVDQAELAVLNVRHVALRCGGLAGKVVILDEVHAYDVYMTTILERLLTWLHALGSSVIVLSATLPAERRRALARAWGDSGPVPSVVTDYPRLEAISAAGHHVTAPRSAQEGRVLGLRWINLAERAAEDKARWLLERVAEGGCACWITNTVAQSQELYAELRARAPADMPLDLMHSRFPLEQRERIEGRIMERYGPQSADDRRGIVVGTQVLEQSLDLDFDVMVSDLAPIDLLLQRAGRLCRHHRPGRRVAQPVLWVNVERERDGSASLGVNAVIYAEYVLLRTLLALEGRSELHLPDDYRPLIEAVYVEGEPAEAWLRASWGKYQADAYSARKEAEQRLLPAPLADEAFCATASSLMFQENEDSARWGVAQTRLGADSVTLVPLERHGSRASLSSAGLELSPEESCSRQVALTLLRHAVRVSHQTLVRAIEEAKGRRPVLFDHPLLRYVQPLWLRDGHASVGARGETHVSLDRELGLVIDSPSKGETL